MAEGIVGTWNIAMRESMLHYMKHYKASYQSNRPSFSFDLSQTFHNDTIKAPRANRLIDRRD